LCSGFQHANLVGQMSVSYNLDFVQGNLLVWPTLYVIVMYNDAMLFGFFYF
jgi:hypothetical protein